MAKTDANHTPVANPESDATTYDRFVVVLNEHEQSAVNAWKHTHNIRSTNQALRELIRLGLLSEISKSFETVDSIRNSVS